jgi:lipopolysaccharide export system protein LptA
MNMCKAAWAPALVLSWMLAGLAAPLSPASAQGFAEGLQGLTRESNAPIDIQADALEVRDAERVAIFTGNVLLSQGEVTMRTKELKVFYTGGAEAGGSQDIDRLEAVGQVVVTSGDQQATGEKGVFESSKNLVTLSGDVVLTQGQNVLRGSTLVVDLAKGTSQVLSDGKGDAGQRVQGLFRPGTVREEAAR